MSVKIGSRNGWPHTNFGMEMRGTQTDDSGIRQSIVYPRRKYTFLVEFFFNTHALLPVSLSTDLPKHIHNGRLLTTLRSIDHPKATMVTETLNSYNKKVIIPKKMEYSPATMTFHDDNTSVALSLWREYRAFYQYEGRIGKNSVDAGNPNNNPIGEFRNGNALVGDDVRSSYEALPSMGMTLKPNDGRHFFDAIRIYDLGSDPDSVNVYTFLHPVINSFDHENLDYEDRDGVVGLTMSFDYEGYYHLVGLNNAAFSEIIEEQLGVRPNGNSGRVEGHAVMEGLTNPDVFDPDLGNGFPVDSGSLVDPLAGVIGTSADTVSFPVTPFPPVTPITATPLPTLLPTLPNTTGTLPRSPVVTSRIPALPSNLPPTPRLADTIGTSPPAGGNGSLTEAEVQDLLSRTLGRI